VEGAAPNPFQGRENLLTSGWLLRRGASKEDTPFCGMGEGTPERKDDRRERTRRRMFSFARFCANAVVVAVAVVGLN
jgi:hypothetical protein